MSASSLDCVKVSVRVRPFVPSELERGCRQIVEKTPEAPQLLITGDSYSKPDDFYTFDNVFMMNDSQESIYEMSVKPMIEKLFEGFNVTVLAYGQTSSGKTYTMGTCFDGDWNSNSTGIIPRSLQEIFGKVRELSAAESTVVCSCSFMELYCENLFDLLSGKEKESSICDIREDFNKEIFIKNLTEHEIADETEAAKFLIQGGENRTTGATAMNDASSRSHAIFTVNITVVNSSGHSTKAKFTLVDLAGSERSKKTKATGRRFTEGVKINEGLLALGNVISALGGGSSSGFVSYRDSKLTRLLQDSLGGNSLTLVIACVSPADYNIEETLSTLRYADRAKKIRNKPVKNQDPHQAEIIRLNEIISELREKLVEFEGGEKTLNCESMKVKTDLYDTNELLRQQLKNLTVKIENLESDKMKDEKFLQKFIGKFQEFRDLVVKITSSISVPELAEILDDLNAMISEKSQENSPKFNVKFSNDDTAQQKMLEYTAKKLTAKKKIRKLERAMKAKQKFLDLQEIPDESILSYESKIRSLETEIEDLRGLVARRDANATVINTDRKEKIFSLEKELAKLRRKCEDLEKFKKNEEKERKRVENLKRGLQDMKAAKLQLVKQQQLESKRFKAWIASRDKEIKDLTQKGRKLQNELVKKNREHEKQQAAMKREIEKAKAVNKRLQDAIDRSKKVSSTKVSSEDIREYIDSELMLLLSSIDAKTVMGSLQTQQAFLMDQLSQIRLIPDKTEDMKVEMKRIEADLVVCNGQISAIREKVKETDVDEKLKMIPGTFNSNDALKIALEYVMKILVELRQSFTTAEMKVEDLQVASEFNKERMATMFEEMCNDKEQFKRMKMGMEHDFMMKLTMIAEEDSESPMNVTYTINCSDSGNVEKPAIPSRKRKSTGEINDESFMESLKVQLSMTSDDESFQLLKDFTIDWNKITNESKPRQLCFDDDF